MNAIKGTYSQGQIVLKEKANWPDGIEVLIEPLPREQTLGIRDEDWPTDPEGIARLLARMDQIEPLEMTPEEEGEWLAARQAQKDHDLANWEERARRIEKLFE